MWSHFQVKWLIILILLLNPSQTLWKAYTHALAYTEHVSKLSMLVKEKLKLLGNPTLPYRARGATINPWVKNRTHYSSLRFHLRVIYYFPLCRNGLIWRTVSYQAMVAWNLLPGFLTAESSKTRSNKMRRLYLFTQEIEYLNIILVLLLKMWYWWRERAILIYL